MYVTRISPGYYICRVGGHRVAVIRHAGVWRVSPALSFGQQVGVCPDVSGWEAYRILAAAKARAEEVFEGLAA